MNKTAKKDRTVLNPLDRLISNTSKADNQDNPDNPENVDIESLQGKSDAEINASKPDNIGKSDNPSNIIKTEPSGDDFIVRTYKVRKRYDELLDRIAFWEHDWKQDVLDRILAKELEGRVLDPIPPGKKGK